MALERARSWLFDIFAHNHAENLRTRRTIERKAMGVEQPDLPYPGAVHGSGNVTNNYQSGFLKPALLTAVLLATGGAGALGVTSLLGGAPSLPTIVAPITTPLAKQAFDAVYEQQQPDGSWKVIKREHLK